MNNQTHRNRRTRIEVIRSKQDQIQEKIAACSDRISQLQKEYDLLEEEACNLIEQENAKRREKEASELLDIAGKSGLTIDQIRELLLNTKPFLTSNTDEVNQ